MITKNPYLSRIASEGIRIPNAVRYALDGVRDGKCDEEQAREVVIEAYEKDIADFRDLKTDSANRIAIIYSGQRDAIINGKPLEAFTYDLLGERGLLDFIPSFKFTLK